MAMGSRTRCRCGQRVFSDFFCSHDLWYHRTLIMRGSTLCNRTGGCCGFHVIFPSKSLNRSILLGCMLNQQHACWEASSMLRLNRHEAVLAGLQASDLGGAQLRGCGGGGRDVAGPALDRHARLELHGATGGGGEPARAGGAGRGAGHRDRLLPHCLRRRHRHLCRCGAAPSWCHTLNRVSDWFAKLDAAAQRHGAGQGLSKEVPSLSFLRCR